MAGKDLNTFEQLFRELFKPLCNFSRKYVGDLEEAKSLVHEVFVVVWEKFDTLPPDCNYRSYLYTAVRNKCLNHIRDRKKHVMLDSIPDHAAMEVNTSLETSELGQEIEFGIQALPEKCREVFELSRMEGLKYDQIASKLNISVKTVEAHMSKALTMLRIHLKEFMTLLLFMHWH